MEVARVRKLLIAQYARKATSLRINYYGSINFTIYASIRTLSIEYTFCINPFL